MADKFIKSITFVEGGDQYYPLPKVTNADDGKVLKVINGEWVAIEAPSGGGRSGQYVWSKQESETGPIIGYVIGETETEYPDGGLSDGFWYMLKLGPETI